MAEQKKTAVVGTGSESHSGESSHPNNKAQSMAELLDDEGDLSPAFTRVLEEIFIRFSHTAQEHIKTSISKEDALKGVEKLIILSDVELDAFTKLVNEGQVLDAASKEEMKEYLNVDNDGNLTFAGFCEMYHLQSGSDEEETWKDLKALGYNDQLQLVETEADTQA